MKPRLNYIYVLFPKPTRANRSIMRAGKVGVSESPKRRKLEIQADMSRLYGRKITLWSFIPIPVLFAYKLEKTIHNVAQRTYGRRYDILGTGKTEWFKVKNYFSFISAWLYFSSLYGFEKMSFYCAVILIVFIPLDLILCAVLLALAQWGALGLVGWLIYKQINF